MLIDYEKIIQEHFPSYDVAPKGEGCFFVFSDRSGFSYYINTKDKCITATLSETRSFFNDPLIRLVSIYPDVTGDDRSHIFKLAEKQSNNYVIKHVGKARCHELDEFDIAKGVTIARSRAVTKFNDSKRKRTILSRLLLLNMEQKLAEEQLECEDKIERYTKLINSLSED